MKFQVSAENTKGKMNASFSRLHGTDDTGPFVAMTWKCDTCSANLGLHEWRTSGDHMIACAKCQTEMKISIAFVP